MGTSAGDVVRGVALTFSIVDAMGTYSSMYSMVKEPVSAVLAPS
jgi:hypothetical protein